MQTEDRSAGEKEKQKSVYIVTGDVASGIPFRIEVGESLLTGFLRLFELLVGWLFGAGLL